MKRREKVWAFQHLQGSVDIFQQVFVNSTTSQKIRYPHGCLLIHLTLDSQVRSGEASLYKSRKRRHLMSCAFCRAEQRVGQPPFRKCGKCVQNNLVAVVYCSTKCQKEDWPTHRAWHTSVQDLLEKAVTPEVAQAKIHSNLAGVHRDANNYALALPELLAAIELLPESSEDWGATVSVAWCTALATDGVACSEDDRPAWMADTVSLVHMAERAVTASPNAMQAWVMLGLGLSQQGTDLGKASTAMMRAAKLAPEGAVRAGYCEAARSLLQQVQQVEKAT